MESLKQKSIFTLGNGQLGLMLQKAAKRLQIPFESLSLQEAWDCLPELDAKSCLITFEQEHVDEALLEEITKSKIPCFPSMESFQQLRNKLIQKELLTQLQIPTSPYLAVRSGADLDNFLKLHHGAILKAGQGGYDGKGVWRVDEQGQTRDGKVSVLASQRRSPYLEKVIPFDFELASVVCRSANGEIVHYPSVKSLQRDGICYQVEFTREFAESNLAKKAAAISAKIAESLGSVGVLAVELFAVGEDLVVNEIAPRVHNSGHFTIDVCAGSQFENHLRAGLGMPLARTEATHAAAVMANLLLYAKLTCGPDWPSNVKFHWYGKSEIRPNRKMGHFTVYGDRIEECRSIAQQVLASRWA